jgi:Secretion system C-terminal sorting domain
MKKKISGFAILCFLLHVLSASGTTWKTISNGYWSNPSTWLGGVAPPYSCADSIIIEDAILLDADLILELGGYLRVDSIDGGICGHYNMTVTSGAEVWNHGLVELETLSINGGGFYCVGSAHVVITASAAVLEGGYLAVLESSSMAVGPWFDCELPLFAFALGVEDGSISTEMRLFPNPFSNSTTLQTSRPLSNATLTIYNSLGQIADERKNIFGNSIEFNRENLSAGFYYMRLSEGHKTYVMEELVIEDN